MLAIHANCCMEILRTTAYSEFSDQANRAVSPLLGKLSQTTAERSWWSQYRESFLALCLANPGKTVRVGTITPLAEAIRQEIVRVWAYLIRRTGRMAGRV